MKDIKIISASAKSKGADTQIQRSMDYYEAYVSDDTDAQGNWYNNNPEGIDVVTKLILNNTDSLASICNKEIEYEANKNKILVCVHDDCIIEDLFLPEKLNEAINQYDIIGLAGIKAPITIKPPCLWHLMGHPSQYSGAVAHFDKGDLNHRFMTTYGKTPERVILLDGVFLAINIEKILKKGLRFDERNPAKFHFYDLNLSLDANQLGLKLGTWPIWVTHKSHGLEQPSEDWIKGQEYILKKYS